MTSTFDAVTTADHETTPRTTQKVLVGIYGQEPDGWAREVPRTVPRTGIVRILVVDEGGIPAFTSLLPVARRRYGGALAEWRRQAEDRRRACLDGLLRDLSTSAEVVEVPSGRHCGRTIAAHANDWQADVVVVARDGRGRVERALLGSVHECVVKLARCPVLVIPAEPLADTSRSAPGISVRSRAAAPGA